MTPGISPIIKEILVMSDIKLEDIEAMSDEDIANLTWEDHAELKRQREDIDRKAEPKIDAQTLRTQILDHGLPMIRELQDSFHNNNTISIDKQKAYDKLWPILENMISKTEDLKIIEAKNASEVISAVAKGKMTLTDAAAFMALMRDQVTIEELPKLLERLSDAESE